MLACGTVRKQKAKTNCITEQPSKWMTVIENWTMTSDTQYITEHLSANIYNGIEHFLRVKGSKSTKSNKLKY